MKVNESNDPTLRTVSAEATADIRLLVLDIDGTMMDESNLIRDSVKQAIASVQRRGVAVVLATGRLFQSSLPAYDSIASTLPLICCEGALIRERNNGFVHRHWTLDPYVLEQILDCTERLSLNGRFSVHFYIQDNVYVSNLNDATTRYFEGSKVEPIVVSDLRQLLNQPTTKVVLLSEDVQVIEELSRWLKNSNARTGVKQYKSLTLLELFHPDVSKRLAVSYLAEEIMSLRPENVMAIGDDPTDIELLQYAGVGVAMGNAPAAVKAAADWVTTNIEEDGVARAVERWILNKRAERATGVMN